MAEVENSVFISYRRSTSSFFARAIFQDLRDHDFDVFMDVESIDSGEFKGVIFNQIAARAHFLVILTPGSVERCIMPKDWLRREVEHAIDLQRNIIPLLDSSFSFRDADTFLTGKLKELKRLNTIRIPHDYFEQAMEKLRTRFLKIPIDVRIDESPEEDQEIIRRKATKALQKSVTTSVQLWAEAMESLGDRKRQKGDFSGAIEAYSEVVGRYPYPKIYRKRGDVFRKVKDYPRAIADYNMAISLNPRYSKAYLNRGYTYQKLKDYDRAIVDYDMAISLKPRYAKAYRRRGDAYRKRKKYDHAIADYTRAIVLKPEYTKAYRKRGDAFRKLEEYERAVADYERALELDPRLKSVLDDRISIAKSKRK